MQDFSSARSLLNTLFVLAKTSQSDVPDLHNEDAMRFALYFLGLYALRMFVVKVTRGWAAKLEEIFFVLVYTGILFTHFKINN